MSLREAKSSRCEGRLERVAQDRPNHRDSPRVAAVVREDDVLVVAQFILAMSSAAFGVFLCHYLILTWLTFKVLGEDVQPTLATMTFKFTVATAGAFILSYTALRIPWLRRVF